MTRVASSAARKGITSVSLTSASLPTLRKRLKPMPRPMVQSMMPPHSAPDCDRNAMLPLGGIPLTKVVLSGVCMSITPMPFGPTIRMPWRCAIATISASRAAPSGPTSRKPPEMTTAALMPRWPHASIAPATIPAGRISTASSTGSGTACDVGVALQPKDLIGFRIDRIDRAGVAALGIGQVADNAVAQLAGVTAGADDGDAVGGEEGRQGRRTWRERGHGQLRC